MMGETKLAISPELLYDPLCSEVPPACIRLIRLGES